MKNTCCLLVSGLLAGAANAQETYVADFSTLNVGFIHGAILKGDEYNSLIGGGFNFEVKGRNGINSAIVFDTRQRNTADPDLELPIIGGNLKGAHVNDLLIFANDLYDKNRDGLVDRPNDSASGGNLRIRFNESNVQDFGFALVDAPENSETFGITFADRNGRSAQLSFEEYLKVSGTQGFVAGNNHANQFAQTSAKELGLSNIQYVDIQLYASGGIDNITWTEGGVVPEPSSALLALVSVAMITRRRR